MPHTKQTAADAVKQTIETVTLPTGITVSSMTFMGIQLADWVFIGTAFLLFCNLALTIPKVFSKVRSLFKRAKPEGRE